MKEVSIQIKSEIRGKHTQCFVHAQLDEEHIMKANRFNGVGMINGVLRYVRK